MHDNELTLYQAQYIDLYSCEIQKNVNTVILSITGSPATYWQLIQFSLVITYCNYILTTICKWQILTIYQISTNKGYAVRHEIWNVEYFGQTYLHYNETILHFGNIYRNTQHPHSSQTKRTRTTRTPSFWWFSMPPHDYLSDWVILEPKSKEDKIKDTSLKNLPKF